MTRERTKELMPVLQAWAEGKEIQVAVKSSCERPSWQDYQGDNGEPNFANEHWIWRVKPEPREFWAVVPSFGYGVGYCGCIYNTRETAAERNPSDTLILVREVL